MVYIDYEHIFINAYTLNLKEFSSDNIIKKLYINNKEVKFWVHNDKKISERLYRLCLARNKTDPAHLVYQYVHQNINNQPFYSFISHYMKSAGHSRVFYTCVASTYTFLDECKQIGDYYFVCSYSFVGDTDEIEVLAKTIDYDFSKSSFYDFENYISRNITKLISSYPVSEILVIP